MRLSTRLFFIALILIVFLIPAASAVTQYNYTLPGGQFGIIVWNGSAGNYTWQVPANITQATEIVIVGGGGSGGQQRGGGGGAGGFINVTNIPVNGTIQIQIGANGTVGTASLYGTNGGNSSFGVYRADGGGTAGIQNSRNGKDGASGGAGSGNGGAPPNAPGGLSNSTPYQGNWAGSGNNSGEYGGGGGGGSSIWGANGTSSIPGIGGNGTVSYITGQAVNYSWGGDGASTSYGSNAGETKLWNITGYVQTGVGFYNGVGNFQNNGFGGHGGSAAADNTGHGENGIVILKYPLQLTPSTDFVANVTTGQAPLVVGFTDLSGNSPNQWAWDFNNDGIIDSTLQNPTWTYNANGLYTVNLTASNAYGNTTKSKVAYIAVGQPLVSFTGTPTLIDAGQSVQFTDASSGTPTGWNWTFGDGNQTIGTKNPLFTYNVPGTYTVTLNASNMYGYGFGSRVAYIVVQPYGTPIASFTAGTTSGTPGVLAAFTDTSFRGGNVTTNYTWNFGDAFSPSNIVYTNGSTTHVYGNAGTYFPTLTLTNLVGTSTYTGPQITVSIAQNQQNIWYSPKQISITIVSFNPAGVHQPNAKIYINVNGTSLQSITQLQTIFGISQTAANQMANGTLIMQGVTDGEGVGVFTIQSSLTYNCVVTDPNTGLNYSTQLFPGLDPYTIWIGQSAINQTGVNVVQAQLNNTALYTYQPDPSNVTDSLRYQDISGYTTDVLFIVKAAGNMTIMYQQDLGNPGTGVVLANWTHLNQRGQGYYFYYNASRSTP
jgi:PKD repeat protein